MVELVSGQALIAFTVVVRRRHLEGILASSLFVRLCEFLVVEQAALFISAIGWPAAFFVVVSDVIEAVAHRIAAHATCVKWLQKCGDLRGVVHYGIEPEFVDIGIEDYGHSVMHSRGHGVWRSGQNRAGLQPIPARILPAVPETGDRKQLPSVHFKAKRLLGSSRAFPFVKAIGGNQTAAIFESVREYRLGTRRF